MLKTSAGIGNNAQEQHSTGIFEAADQASNDIHLIKFPLTSRAIVNLCWTTARAELGTSRFGPARSREVHKAARGSRRYQIYHALAIESLVSCACKNTR